MKKSMMIAIVLILIFGSLAFYTYNKEQQLAKDIQYEHLDVSTIKDGSYLGAYSTTMVHAEVSVSIESGEITKISLIKHDNGKGYNAESIIDDIIESNSTNVDTISGATVSSKVIMKAVENALIEGRN